MSGLEQKYFVLKPRQEISDDAYADSIEHENPELANDLRLWVDKESSLSFKAGMVHGITKVDDE